MIKIDLVTGFLGAGKTTFIEKYAKYLMETGQKIAILENDFGAVNVDMLLLQDIAGENCELEMIAGGCDKDCHYRRMKTKLISMGMRGFDRILVEPSGIFEVDEFFDILHDEPLDRWYEIGNVMAVVNAGLEEDLSGESKYLLVSQIANAGKIILSRAQETSPEKMARTIQYLNQTMEQFHCKRRFQETVESAPELLPASQSTGDGKADALHRETSGEPEGDADTDVLCKDWEKLTAQDFEELLHCGYVSESYEKLWFDQKEAFDSLYFMNLRMSEEALCKAAESIMKDTACGRIFRIKGFMPTNGNQWVELNATQENIVIRPIRTGQEVLIVIGEHLNEAAIRTYWERER